MVRNPSRPMAFPQISELKGWWAVLPGPIVTLVPKALGFVAKEAMEAYAMYRNRESAGLKRDMEQLQKSIYSMNKIIEEDRKARARVYERLDDLGQRVAVIEGMLRNK